jgi:hypothetical protein
MVPPYNVDEYETFYYRADFEDIKNKFIQTAKEEKRRRK